MTNLPPIIAEPIFHVGSFPVTNAYINSLLAVLFFFIVGLLLRNRKSLRPGKLQNFAESVLELMLGYVDSLTKDRKKSLKILPIVGGLFLFILLSNWMSQIPGTGSIGRYLLVDGHKELVPLLRPANSDLNLTLAMAISAVVISHVLGIAAIGFFRYSNKFIKVGDVVGSFGKGGSAIMVAFIEFGVGFLEIISEVAKMVSLSLRLFGNIFAGEVLLTVLAGLIPYVVPLPFMFLEILVGLIQAIVFAMLALVYIYMATAPLPEASHH